jgi:hypothetical protein
MAKPASFLAVLLFLVPIVAALDRVTAGGSLGVDVDDPEEKVLEGPDDEGELTIGVRVAVKNTSESEESVDLVVQGLDRDGYEVFEFVVSGVIKPGQSRTLTDRDYLSDHLHSTIVRWRVDQVSIRGAQPGSAARPSHAPPGKERRG